MSMHIFLSYFSYSILTLVKLSDDFNKHECIDKSFCFICNWLNDCSCGSCDCSKCLSGCCENCGKCCAKYCRNDYETLKRENDNLRERNRK